MIHRHLLLSSALAMLTNLNAQCAIEDQRHLAVDEENNQDQIHQMEQQQLLENNALAMGLIVQESSDILWAYRPNSYQLQPAEASSKSGIAFLRFTGSTTYHYDFPQYRN